MTTYQHQLDHLVKMASIPGFKDHAWLRAKELDSEIGFEGIKDDLIKSMKNIGNAEKGRK